MHLEHDSQPDPSNLGSLPSVAIYQHGHDVTDSLSLIRVAEALRIPEGFVGLGQMESFARLKYPNDVTLAAWTWGALLQDRVFFESHQPNRGAAGRPCRFDVRHAITLQTREEWMDSSKDTELLRSPALWLIGRDSLRSQYHRLYVHQIRDDGSVDNNCHDGQGHSRYVAPHGYSSDLRHIDAALLDQQANEQGVNPCIYSFLREWALTQLG